MDNIVLVARLDRLEELRDNLARLARRDLLVLLLSLLDVVLEGHPVEELHDDEEVVIAEHALFRTEVDFIFAGGA